MWRNATCSIVFVALLAIPAAAEVDQRPLNVKIEPAFPNVKWPDWVRGLDEGKPRDPRPLLFMGAGDGTNRIFVGSEYGTIHVWPNDPSASEMKTFLDIRNRVQYDDKQNEEDVDDFYKRFYYRNIKILTGKNEFDSKFLLFSNL